MNWRVVGDDGFIYAEFAYAVDALEFKKHAPEYMQDHLYIKQIGEDE